VWIPENALPRGPRGDLFRTLLSGFNRTDAGKEPAQCPDCESRDLEQVERSGFQLRRCTRCTGVWIDGNTLQRIRGEIGSRWMGFLVEALGKGLAGVIKQ
jgi:hypothetical protein